MNLSLGALTASTSVITPLALGSAMLAGLLAAFGPSTYPLIPAVLGYEVALDEDRAPALKRALLIVAGMVCFDLALGAAAGALGEVVARWLAGNLATSYALTAAIMLLLGLRFIGILRFRVPSATLAPRTSRSAPWEAFALGAAFGVAACPACTPLLLAILLGAVATKSVVFGAVLLGVFALGRGLPLLVVAVSANAFRRMRLGIRLSRRLDIMGGWLMVASAVYFGYQSWSVWNGAMTGM